MTTSCRVVVVDVGMSERSRERGTGRTALGKVWRESYVCTPPLERHCRGGKGAMPRLDNYLFMKYLGEYIP